MVCLRTRSYAQDYIFLSKDSPDDKWLDIYKRCKFLEPSDKNLFIEIVDGKINAYLGRFTGERRDLYDRSIGYEIFFDDIACGSDDTQLLLNIVNIILNDGNLEKAFSEIGKNLDVFFTKDFVDTFFNEKNYESIDEKLQEFKSSLKIDNINTDDEQQCFNGFYCDKYDNMTEETKKMTSLILKYISNNDSENDIFCAFVLTSVYLENEVIHKFTNCMFAQNKNIYGVILGANTEFKFSDFALGVLPYLIKKEETYTNDGSDNVEQENAVSLDKKIQELFSKIKINPKYFAAVLTLVGIVATLIATKPNLINDVTNYIRKKIDGNENS